MTQRQINTMVVFADPYVLQDFRDINSYLVDYKTYVEVYTDDDHGNGNLLYLFELVEGD